MAGGKIYKASGRGLSRPQKKQTSRIVKSQISRNMTSRHYDEYGPVNCGTTAAITDITTMVRGTAEGAFIGDEIMLTGVELRYNLRQVAASTEPCMARFIIFQWKDDDATAPLVGDILHDPTNDGHVSNYLDSGRFKVLADRMFNLNENHVGGVTSKAGYIRKWKGFNKKVTFKAGASTGKNKIYLMSFGDLTTNPPSLEFHSRIHYKD